MQSSNGLLSTLGPYAVERPRGGHDREDALFELVDVLLSLQQRSWTAVGSMIESLQRHEIARSETSVTTHDVMEQLEALRSAYVASTPMLWGALNKLSSMSADVEGHHSVDETAAAIAVDERFDMKGSSPSDAGQALLCPMASLGAVSVQSRASEGPPAQCCCQTDARDLARSLSTTGGDDTFLDVRSLATRCEVPVHRQHPAATNGEGTATVRDIALRYSTDHSRRMDHHSPPPLAVAVAASPSRNSNRGGRSIPNADEVLQWAKSHPPVAIVNSVGDVSFHLDNNNQPTRGK